MESNGKYNPASSDDILQRVNAATLALITFPSSIPSKRLIEEKITPNRNIIIRKEILPIPSLSVPMPSVQKAIIVVSIKDTNPPVINFAAKYFVLLKLVSLILVSTMSSCSLMAV